MGVTFIISLLFVLIISLEGARYEAEDGKYTGVTFANSVAGYSGRGYVTNFVNDGDQILITVTTNAAPYEIIIGYHAIIDKGFDLQVNDEKGNGFFKATGNGWGTVSAGKFLLNSGNNNTIIVSKGWGWFEVDYVDVNPTTIKPPIIPSKQLSDSKATPSTRSLFSFLVDNYGHKVLAGQYDAADIEYIKNVTGHEPAVGGFDLMDYSPSRVEHGANATGQIESEISWALKSNGLVTLSWHWNAPCDLIDQPGKEWWRGFYTYATTYDIAYALVTPTSQEYTKLIRDLDAIAIQLKKFQDANTPILWRPLHEASGGWFWWGAKGAAPFKKLWRLMYDRYVNEHQLHHLVWVYTAAAGAEDWYPGNDVVDVVGLDIYTSAGSSMSGSWEGIQADFNGKKIVTLSESGTLPVPDKIRGLGVWWSWFSVWSGMIQPIPKDQLQAVYADPSIVKVDQLPDWRKYPQVNR